MKLMIVESPTKAKKLRSFLDREHRVEASFGHVRDLPAKGDLAVGFVDGRVEPRYEPLERSRDRVARIRALARDADAVLLATDPDREGEAIAWHVAELLDGGPAPRRVSFNAVTKAAVAQALESPRDLDLALVGAQQARRVLDRVVGWIVSPTLRAGLADRAARSAGRVQSVALRFVVERERAIRAFDATTYFSLRAKCESDGNPPAFTADLVEWKGDPLAHRLRERDLTERTLEWCRRQEWRVASQQRREQKRRPPPPFVTATVQQAASVKLEMTPKRCMQCLQKLFEDGRITYHRTDSVWVEPDAVAAARAEIAKRYGEDYLPGEPVGHATRGGNAQEAHEAIRPTEPAGGPGAAGKDDQGRLYRLIWNRFIASQMADARDHLTAIRIAVAPGGHRHAERGEVAVGIFETKGRVVLFDGWRKLGDDATEERKKKKKDEEPVAELPDLAAGDPIAATDLEVREHTTKPPPRFTQASLIKKLESEGIGRPSTYAAIMATIVDREYVTEKRRKLHATDLGERVADYLVQHFADHFIDPAFTAAMEARLDAIARGDEDWQAMTTEAAFAVRDRARRAALDWDPLDPASKPPDPHAPHPDAPPCPLCGGGMAKRRSRFGPFYACLDRACPAICDLDGRPNAATRRALEERDGG